MRNFEVKSLLWDSDFFGFCVSRIDNYSSEASELKIAVLDLFKSGSQLIYLFSLAPVSFMDGDFCAAFVDEKLSYVKRPQSRVMSIRDFEIKPVEEVSEEIYELAYEAGQKSRYKVDSRISEQDFKRLYRTWIDNSINGSYADYVFAAVKANSIVGLITASVKNEILSIGLIATTGECRGKGVGSAMIQHVENLANELGFTLEVTTQAANYQACRFYEKLGFEIAARWFVYHIWPVC